MKIHVPTAVVILLVLAGCSQGDARDVSSPTESINPLLPTEEPSPEVDPEDVAVCQDQVDDFLKSMQEIDSRLDVGLTPDAFSGVVGDAKVAYDQLPLDEMDQTCIAEAGVPLENALNQYLKANTQWSNCVGNVSCTTDSILHDLREKWGEASDQISDAEAYLSQA
jgi:hypothetical protein